MQTPRKSLLSDFTDAKSESKGQGEGLEGDPGDPGNPIIISDLHRMHDGARAGDQFGVEKKKRKGEGENGQMVESKKSKTGEDWDKPIGEHLG